MEPDAKDEAHLHHAAEAAREFPTGAEAQYPLPPSVISVQSYTDLQQFELELTRIFYRSLFPACPSVDVLNARDYVVGTGCGNRWLSRARMTAAFWPGTASASTRGARLLYGSGSCKAGRFACLWHGFVYDLSGKVPFPRSEVHSTPPGSRDCAPLRFGCANGRDSSGSASLTRCRIWRSISASSGRSFPFIVPSTSK